jgi:riboflavin biosynthesis pyrimidine reductase
MDGTLTRLYPDRCDAIPVRGLYLAHRLHTLGSSSRPFIYANFVQSLDGRIALRDPSTGIGDVPRALTSPNDLRLLLELHAQADCLVTNGAYLRAVAEGRLGDILQVGTVPGHEDLADWREANGLSRQPAVCIASASLDFPLAPSLVRYAQQVFVATGRKADAARVRALEDEGRDVVFAGSDDAVEGAELLRVLASRKLRTAFLLSGPRMLDTTLRDGVLSRFYVTITHELLGGEHFHSLLEGPAMSGAGRLRLSELYLDSAAPSEQLFAQFRPLHAQDADRR